MCLCYVYKTRVRARYRAIEHDCQNGCLSRTRVGDLGDVKVSFWSGSYMDSIFEVRAYNYVYFNRREPDTLLSQTAFV